MGLVEQWRRLRSELPENWGEVKLDVDKGTWVQEENEIEATAGQPLGLDRAKAGDFITTRG